MNVLTYQVNKIANNIAFVDDDNVVIEAPLQININNESYTVLMRTPGDDEALIRGLLYAEDIYKEDENLSLEFLPGKVKYHDIINVSIKTLGKGYLNKRTLLSVSSCGICGKQNLDSLIVNGEKLEHSTMFNVSELEYWFAIMQSKQEVFNKTGGLHAMMVLSKTLEILTVKEDIGRHNALDKAVGCLLNTKQIKNANVLFVSGRVSYEIISKAFFAKIPVVIAVSACSSLAIDFAKEFGICLIGFSRKDKATIYSNPHFVKID